MPAPAVPAADHLTGTATITVPDEPARSAAHPPSVWDRLRRPWARRRSLRRNAGLMSCTVRIEVADDRPGDRLLRDERLSSLLDLPRRPRRRALRALADHYDSSPFFGYPWYGAERANARAEHRRRLLLG